MRGSDEVRTKSPLREPPGRMPGQSLAEELAEQTYDQLLFWIMLAAWFVMAAATEWMRWLLDAPYHPVVATAVAGAACALAFWRIRRAWPGLKRLRLGAMGERAVGLKLERLRARGYEVFHDIIGDGHNIDHALVGPGGVYAIETKTHRKPARGPCEVVFDGTSLTVNGFAPDRDPVVQVQAAGAELARIIRDTCNRDLFVRPVLVHPGWFVRRTGRSRMWVLNENALPKFLAAERPCLTPDEVARIASGIEMYVRCAAKAASI